MQSDGFERPGPVPVPGDSWVDAPTSARHRLGPSRRSLRYLWVLAVLAGIAIVPTVAVPLLSGQGSDAPGLTGDSDTSSAAIRPGTTAASGGGIVMVTAPPEASATRPAGSGAGGAPPAGNPAPTTATTSAPPPPPAPLPLALEAEGSGVSLVKAQIEAVADASGGQAARFTGTPGMIRFLSIAVATGTYRVTVTYAPAAQASGTVQGIDGQVAVTFAAGSGCCATVSAQVPIQPGATLTIRLTSASGTYPAIDRVVIENV